jgi:pyruvate/2-oxoglutarate/acetoin dehydrogenase E1 component/TPP-dependent pyruvate/acetoin dehydrogenase alpha subunit
LSSTKALPDIGISKKEILDDYRLVVASREASLIGRKEVFMGKAKFGIFGDGKELPQIALAKVFKPGDFRSGYYRDQTLMFAIGESSIQQYFAQLYAHTDVKAEPASAGRLMNGHFATRMLDQNGKLKDLAKLKNSASDISPTAGQMPRLLGLAWASKLFRNNKELKTFKNLSKNGNEIAFGTIGDASTSEGIFLETINAAGILQVPMVISIWDDGHGISVPKEYHTVKGSISKALEGMQRSDQSNGIEILRVKGWDYPALCKTYERAVAIARLEHVPVLVHVEELTQPQGHSTSGSHERYKSEERLEWEREFDCNRKFKEWILENGIVTEEEIHTIEADGKNEAKHSRSIAWKEFTTSITEHRKEAVELIEKTVTEYPEIKEKLIFLSRELKGVINPLKMDVMRSVRKALYLLRTRDSNSREDLKKWLEVARERAAENYNSHLYSESEESALEVGREDPQFSPGSQTVDGREILLACFDSALERDPRILAFGEDLGKIGDVNQAFAGLQAKYGEMRVGDTGIREATIIGQGVGSALRGLKPIAEIQYLDYLVYALMTITDDLASLQYRTKGGQKAPLIIRTRGHRLEGVWHAGSPMGMILGSMRGIYILVPRNMTKAAAFYNTLFKSDDTALMIECLNGYRLKERLPDNIGEITEPLGIPEVIREGNDITIVTYGSMCRVAMEAARQLEDVDVSLEVIDIQTLLPFDINNMILESVKKTNRIIFADEDVPGGASGFMMQQVLEKQQAYKYLDSQPVTLTAKDHRPAYSSDGDYFSKPSAEDIFEKAYALMAESDPSGFPDIF